MSNRKKIKRQVAPINNTPYTAVEGSSWECFLLGRAEVKSLSIATGADMSRTLIGGFIHTRPLTPEEKTALDQAKVSIDHTISWAPDGTRMHVFGFRSVSGFEFIVELAQRYDLAPDQLMKVHIAYLRDSLPLEALERMAVGFKSPNAATGRDSDDKDDNETNDGDNKYE
ncbi:MAG: hypothetical protein IKT86_07670 [Bacteroidaceae bacterium]|nr:hypothetical protein [Bacteroidaceae bacterium]